jgi:nicotinamidase-related amidase
MPNSKDDLHGAVRRKSRAALLVVDMFSDFSFPDGAATARRAWPIAKAVAALKSRLHAARVPTIYVNDNLGLWRSDFPKVWQQAASRTSHGHAIAELLKPGERDYCVLKPRHSAFFATPLDVLLQGLGVRTLILTGSSSHQCILFSATDAYVRGYRLLIPKDCIVSLSRKSANFAHYFFDQVLGADLGRSTSLRVPRVLS